MKKTILGIAMMLLSGIGFVAVAQQTENGVTCGAGKCKKTECAQTECSPGRCATTECAVPDCKKSDCKKDDCKKSDCKKDDCKKSDCKKSDCKKSDCKRKCAGDSCARKGDRCGRKPHGDVSFRHERRHLGDSARFIGVRGNHGIAEGVESRLGRLEHHGKADLFEGITLTELQKSQLKELEAKMEADRKALRADAREKGDEVKADARKGRDEMRRIYRDEVKKILDAEQYAKFEANEKALMAKRDLRRVSAVDRKPKASPVGTAAE